MKRLFIILMTAFLLTGCRKNEPENNSESLPVIIVDKETKEKSTEQICPSDNSVPSLASENSKSEDDLKSENDEKSEVKIVMVGDVLLHDRIFENCKTDEEYDFNPLFQNVKDKIQESDIAIVNQEVIIGGEELGISGYPAFNAPTEVADALYDTGFDVVCHGTNHALDKGRNGILNCLSYWNSTYPAIKILGINDSPEKRNELCIIEKNGIKFAILNYTYGTNGISLPDGMPYAVNLLEESSVRADIRRAESEADFTIVCPHWGTEYRLESDSYQKKWTEIFLEEGVDLVLGTHPHVIEGIENITSEDGSHSMLVYYSLGNFVNWTSGTGDGTSNRMLGGMAEVTISKNENTALISDYTVDALVSHVESAPHMVTAYFLKDYSEDMALSNEIRSQDPSFSYKYLVDLADKIWGELWQ